MKNISVCHEHPKKYLSLPSRFKNLRNISVCRQNPKISQFVIENQKHFSIFRLHQGQYHKEIQQGASADADNRIEAGVDIHLQQENKIFTPVLPEQG